MANTKTSKVRKPLALLFSFLVFCAASCSKDTESPAQPKSELKIYLASEPLSLDPRIGGDRRSQMIMRELFEGLTRMGRDGKPYPAAAEKIEISEDGCTYRFLLRKRQWSSGDPVTAHDFEYAWKSILDPKFPTGFAYAFTFIKGAAEAKAGQIPLDAVGIKAVDDRTLVVELEHPAPYFLELATNPLFSPVSIKACEKDPTWANNGGPSYVCNGPFTLAKWKHQQELQLAKNPNYGMARKISLDLITAPIIEDPQTALSMYEKGDIDWVGEPFGNLPLEAIPDLRKQKKLEMRQVGGMFWYQLNTSHPLFSNMKIRHAFAIALNRKELTDHLLQGGEKPMFSLLPDNLTTLDKPLFKDNDLQKARKLFDEGLQELGLSRNDVKAIKLSHWQEPREKAIAAAVQQQWQKAFNIPINLVACDWNTYLKKFSSSDFDVAGLNWYCWFQDPMYNLESFRFKTSGMNGTNWEHPEYIALLAKADSENDPKQRRVYLQSAEKLIIEEMPIIPVYCHTYKFAKRPSVQGEYLSPVGQLELKDVIIDSSDKAGKE